MSKEILLNKNIRFINNKKELINGTIISHRERGKYIVQIWNDLAENKYYILDVDDKNNVSNTFLILYGIKEKNKYKNNSTKLYNLPIFNNTTNDKKLTLFEYINWRHPTFKVKSLLENGLPCLKCICDSPLSNFFNYFPRKMTIYFNISILYIRS